MRIPDHFSFGWLVPTQTLFTDFDNTSIITAHYALLGSLHFRQPNLHLTAFDEKHTASVGNRSDLLQTDLCLLEQLLGKGKTVQMLKALPSASRTPFGRWLALWSSARAPNPACSPAP